MSTPYLMRMRFNLVIIMTLSMLSITNAGAVTGFSASDGTYNTKIAVTWSGGTTVRTRSEVYRANTFSGVKTYLGNGIVDKSGIGYYDDSQDVMPEVDYYYWVRECSILGAVCGAYEGGDAGFRRLDAPSGISATQGSFTDKVVVSWTGIAGTDPYTPEYQIWRSESENGNKTVIGTAMGTSYADMTAAMPGLGYYYSVSSCVVGGGCNAPTGSALGWRGLSPPASVSASDGTSTTAVTVSWSAVTGASGYEVWRRFEYSAPSLLYTITSPTTTSYENTGIGAGAEAYYKVRAYSIPFNLSLPVPGQFSAEDTGWRAFEIPTGVEASYSTDTEKVVISWNSVTNAMNYQIYRSDAPAGSQVLIGTTTLSDPRIFNDITATPGTPYYYHVAACAGPDYLCGATGGPSIGMRKLSAVADFTAGDGISSDHVPLSWSVVDGAHVYNILRKEGEDNFGYLGDTTDTTFNDTTAFPGRSYSYYVDSFTTWIGHVTVGEASQIDSGWRGVLPPTNITASDGAFTDKVRVVWSPATGDNLTYMVRRKEGELGRQMELARLLPGPPYDDTTAEVEVRYEYSVWSCVSMNESYQCWGGSDIGWVARSCKVHTVSDVTEYPNASFEACETLILGPNFIAADGSNISVSSGWEIDFLSGFLVEQGATLNANVCGQSLCMTSPDPMPLGCHSCIDLICASSPNCCGIGPPILPEGFNSDCLNKVNTVCGLVCE